MTIQTQRSRLVMRVMPALLLAFVLVLLAFGGVPACERAQGQEASGGQAASGGQMASPSRDASPDKRPDARPGVTADQAREFATLYRANCSGCHGADGRGGAALALADPVYLAIADDAIVRRLTAEGVPGTSMPAFAEKSGGTLTDAEVDAIVAGIRRWAKPVASATPASSASPAPPASPDSSASPASSDVPPPYANESPGDVERGAAAFETFCARCHGPDGAGGPKASSIVDPAFLTLVSDQGLRTTVIAGRPELGKPDWRGNLPGRAMTSQEIADVVAWLAAHRPRAGDSTTGSPP